MDLVHDRTSNVAEDRISKLSDDIIHRILSFLDMKYAVQTSAFSKRWKFTWTSMPDLNLDFQTFGGMRQFAKFVKHVLSHRNNCTQVSAVNFTFRGVATQFVVKRILDYACSHNIRKLTMIWFTEKVPKFQLPIFRSHTLKDLTLKTNHDSIFCEPACVPESAWDFPALETLHLSNFKFGGNTDKNINLFSKCVNLKDLTFHECSMAGLEIFNICAPQLSNLTINQPRSFAKTLNVVAPKLENLTASIICKHVDHMELLSERITIMQLSTGGLDFLEKVNLSSDSNYNIRGYIQQILYLFQKLCTAKFLILDMWIIEVLSLCLHQFSHIPCPFNNLRCLKINTGLLSSLIYESDRIAKMAPQVGNYLLENSPYATCIMNLPQIPRMRIRRPVQAVNSNRMANKMAKLGVPTPRLPSATKSASSNVPRRISVREVHNDTTRANLEAEKHLVTILQDKIMLLEAKIQMQDGVMAKQKAMFEAKIQMQDEAMAEQKARFEAKTHMQDEVMAKQKALLEAKIHMQDEVVAKQKEMLETKIQMQDEVIAKQKAAFEVKAHMQDEVIAKQKAMFESKTQMQDDILSKQKAMFEAKIEMRNKGIAEQKVKIQMQNEVIANQKAMFVAKVQMLEVAKSQHEKLMSLIIKWKIAELKVQVESGNPDYEILRSIGRDIKSVIGLIPESLKAVMQSQFTFQYVELKSLLFTRINASQWEKIESELGSNM